jgi:hypothetical protein
MGRAPRIVLAGLVLIAASATAAVLLAGADARAAAEPTGKCCFTNPRYTGVCEVTLGEKETCADVLAYLNNPNSVGKDYCGNSIVRGGWAQVTCEKK